MFFTASKLLSWLLEPASWLLILQVVALWLLWKSRVRAARATLALAVIATLIVTQFPVAGMLIRPLEQRFASAPPLPPRLEGIIVLGGVIDQLATAVYGATQLSAEAERMTEFVALARKHPEAKLVFSGGSGHLTGAAAPEAVAARHFLESQGVNVQRVVFEDRSRNTHENALYTRDLLQPAKGEAWVLITSASHMPRAHAVFRKAGWEIIPYPVSYRALPYFSPWERGYDTLLVALHEWAGIAVYTVTGRM